MPLQNTVIEDLVDLEVPQDARISPSAEHVVYSTKRSGLKGDKTVGTLWIASVGKERSARQLTSGFYNDRSPEWHPNGSTIAFLSDRFKPGESCAIYEMCISGGEAYPLTGAQNKKDISQFRWSPDGAFIGYLSPDEKTPEREAKDKAKDDVKVYGTEWEYNRLRAMHVYTRKVSVHYKEDRHVKEFAWCRTSGSIIFATQQTPDINSPGYYGMDILQVDTLSSSCDTLFHFPGTAFSLQTIGDCLYFASGVTPGSEASAISVYKYFQGEVTRDKYGDEKDVENLSSSQSNLFVKVTDRLSDFIYHIKGMILYGAQHEILKSSWDVTEIADEEYVLACVMSTASSPREVYSFEHRRMVRDITDAVQLSSHGQAIASLNIAGSTKVVCNSDDGEAVLESYFHYPTPGRSSNPAGRHAEPKNPMPTVVLIHGGPYSRRTDRFESPFTLWAPAILSAGKFAVLSPNYRGGSGQGEKFAAHSRGNMGTLDYDDVLTIVDEAIKQGLVDKNRIIVGGWSQGGFLSYVSAVRNGFDHKGNRKGWSFRGVIAGAGVTDWDMMCMSSDWSYFEAELAGGTPWESEDKRDTSSRKGSAVWEMAKAKEYIPPLLILHGEADERVPVSQAIAFHRGCLHHSIPCEMAVYPREPHIFRERAHIIDMLNRVLKFCDLHLGS